MKVIGFNGSPRKNANTATLVETVLKGAASKGAETRLVNLNELNMRGCQGCEVCTKEPGQCAYEDDLTPLLEELKECDAIVLGSPIYWFRVSAQLNFSSSIPARFATSVCRFISMLRFCQERYPATALRSDLRFT